MHNDMLSLGNSHLGPSIWTFSIPAVATCPGSTPACLSACYAKKSTFTLPTPRAMHSRNLGRTEDLTRFTADLVAEVRHKRCEALRIHVAGDFFSAEYARAWTTVARKSPATTFLAYTRSWRIPAMRRALAALARLPNVRLFWSEDRDSGPCHLPGGRRCFLCTTPADEALVPPGVLVFRDRPRTPAKWLGGSWVCPKEQGTGAGITCSTCRWCLGDRPLPTPAERRLTAVQR